MTYNQSLFPKKFKLKSSDNQGQGSKKLNESIDLSQQVSQANTDSIYYDIQEQNHDIVVVEETEEISSFDRRVDRFEGDVSIENNLLVNNGIESNNLSLFKEGLIANKFSLFESGIQSEDYSRFTGFLEMPMTDIVLSNIQISPESMITLHGVLSASTSSRIVTDGKLESRYLQAFDFNCLNSLDTQGDIYFHNVNGSTFTSDIISKFMSSLESYGQLTAEGSSKFVGDSVFEGSIIVQNNNLILDSDEDISYIYSKNGSFIRSEDYLNLESSSFLSFGLSTEAINDYLENNNAQSLHQDKNTGIKILSKDSNVYYEGSKDYHSLLTQGVYIDKDQIKIQHKEFNIDSISLIIDYETNWGFSDPVRIYPTNYLHSISYTVPIFKENIIRPYYEENDSENGEMIGEKYSNGLSKIFTEFDYNKKVKKALVPVGTVISYAGYDPNKDNSNIPENWVLCNGNALSKQEYSELFEVIGDKFNRSSDPSSLIRVPDLRGIFIKGADPRQSEGSNNSDASTGGEDSLVLNDENLPAHQHWMEHSHDVMGSTAHTHGMTHSHNGGTDSHRHAMNHNHVINDPGHDHGFVDIIGGRIPYVITQYNMGQSGKGGGTWEDKAPDCYGTSTDDSNISIEKFTGFTDTATTGSQIASFTGRTANNSSFTLDISNSDLKRTHEAGSDDPDAIPIDPPHMALVYIIKVANDEQKELITEGITPIS